MKTKHILIIATFLFTIIACDRSLMINQDSADMNVDTNKIESVYAPNEVFEVVDEHPMPKDGMRAFYKFIGENLKYPAAEKAAGKQGKVFIEFVVTPDSVLADIRVVKGVSPEIDQAAIDVIQSSPKWKPGLKEGEAVPVRMILPITFKLGESGESASKVEKTFPINANLDPKTKAFVEENKGALNEDFDIVSQWIEQVIKENDVKAGDYEVKWEVANGAIHSAQVIGNMDERSKKQIADFLNDKEARLKESILKLDITGMGLKVSKGFPKE